jgi:WD40 repeat protein
LKGQGWLAQNVAFSPDGKRLAVSASGGSYGGRLKIWEISSTADSIDIAARRGSWILAISPDSKSIIGVGGSGRTFDLNLWDAHTREVRQSFREQPRIDSVAISPDGTLLAGGLWIEKTADMPAKAAIRLWDLKTGTMLKTIDAHPRSIYALAFNPDGKRLASGSDTTIKVWDVQNGVELATLNGHRSSVQCLAFSPDGTRLASGAMDATVRLWNPENGTEALTLKLQRPKDGANAVAFSPDGKRLAAALATSKVQIWNPDTGEEVGALKGHAQNVTSIAYSPDGKRLASTSMDRTVKLWDAENAEELATLKGHLESGSAVSFSHDGNLLASLSRDGTIKIYDATPLPEKP